MLNRDLNLVTAQGYKLGSASGHVQRKLVLSLEKIS